MPLTLHWRRALTLFNFFAALLFIKNAERNKKTLFGFNQELLYVGEHSTFYTLHSQKDRAA